VVKRNAAELDRSIRSGSCGPIGSRISERELGGEKNRKAGDDDGSKLTPAETGFLFSVRKSQLIEPFLPPSLGNFFMQNDAAYNAANRLE
jgi:hypothetical protein